MEETPKIKDKRAPGIRRLEQAIADAKSKADAKKKHNISECCEAEVAFNSIDRGFWCSECRKAA